MPIEIIFGNLHFFCKFSYKRKKCIQKKMYKILGKDQMFKRVVHNSQNMIKITDDYIYIIYYHNF